MSVTKPLRCPVCAGEQVDTLSTAVGARAYCHACFHGWRPTAPSFSYSDVPMCPLGTSAARLRSQIDFFAAYAPAGAAILEIGCATGELAAEARARLDIGRYEAIELSPAAEQAEPRVDMLHRRPLTALAADGVAVGPFDVVIISHVLEHIEAAGDELAAIRKVLAPNGALFVEVPNRSGNRSLPFDDNRSHIHFFSAASLVRLLANHGFEALDVATGARLDDRYADSLRVVARPFAPPAMAPRLLSERIDTGMRVVVWGAGSLADELLANFLAPDQIDFFIDRNPAKVGGRVLGRPVKGPDALGTTPHTILINSIDFADSIAADIAALGTAHRIVRIGDLLAEQPVARVTGVKRA
ncbi:MAG TPA: class I SAM-dependent methyltransferase [Caulobacteraceae bacterium]|jgi:SAM-dependent methyltransferase|nr:class I SAM-dependent methyltransferase [Caulobacteraceae bacterium]